MADEQDETMVETEDSKAEDSYWKVSGKRQRVKTDHTVVEAPDESKKKARVGEKGNGTALTDMPRVVANISKIESGKREMKLLHKVLFGSEGQANKRKANIRSFSGLVGVTTEDATRAVDKLDSKDISAIQGILDIKNRGSLKSERVSVLVDFLKKPTVQHKGSVPVKKAKKTVAKRTRDDDDDDDDDDTQSEIAKLKKQLAALEKKTKQKSPVKKAKPAPKKAKKATKAKKPVKEGPKRPQSAYFLWMNANRDTFKKKNSDATVGEIAKIMGKAWSKMSDEDKKPYEEKYKKAKEAYVKEKAKFDAKKAGAAETEKDAEEEDAEEEEEEEEEDEEKEKEKEEEEEAAEEKEDEKEEAKEEEAAEDEKEEAKEADAAEAQKEE